MICAVYLYDSSKLQNNIKIENDNKQCFGENSILNVKNCKNNFGKMKTKYKALVTIQKGNYPKINYNKKDQKHFLINNAVIGKTTPKLLIVGNSHCGDIVMGQLKYFKETRMGVDIVCGSIDEYKNQIFDILHNYNYVLIQFRQIFNRNDLEITDEYYKQAVNAGILPIITQDRPNLLYQQISCLTVWNPQSCKELKVKVYENQPSYDYLKKYFPKAQIVQTDPMFCDKKYCYQAIGGIPVYSNEWHIGRAFSISMEQAWYDVFDKIFSK
jgi:hypothetical protein